MIAPHSVWYSPP